MIVLQTKVWCIDGLLTWVIGLTQKASTQSKVRQVSWMFCCQTKSRSWFPPMSRQNAPDGFLIHFEAVSRSETSLVIPHIHLGQGKIHYSSLPGTISGKYSPSSLLLVTHNGQHAFRKLIKDVKDITFLLSKIRCWLLSRPTVITRCKLFVLQTW